MANFKKNTYVISTIYGNSIDLFRNAVGNYWELGPFFPTYGDPTSKNNAVLLTNTINKINTFKVIPRKKKVKNLKKYPFFEITHDLEIYADKGYYNSDTSWVNYINKICSSKNIFLDFSFDVETPLSPKELKTQNAVTSATYSQADFVYNYFAKTYELLTDNDQAPETILPNLYLFLKTREDEEDDQAFQALTAGGQLEKSQLRSMRIPKAGNADPQYFNEFGRAQRRTPLTTLNSISSTAKNIIFDTDCDEMIRQGTDFATLFPMFVNLEFTTDSANEMTEVLEDSKLSTSLMSYLSLIPSNPTTEQKERFSMRTEPMKRFFEQVQPASLSNLSTSNISIDSEDVQVNIIDLDRWLKKVSKNKNFIRKSSMILGDNTEDPIKSNFEKMMYLIIFSGKLKTLIDKYNRSYLDISDGAKCFSETICYKVEKFTAEGGSTPLQTFWLPNTNEIDVIKYIDTQVKYNKLYTYRVSAYQFVVGSQYYYKNLKFPDEYDPPTMLDQVLVQQGETANQDFSDSSSSPRDFTAAEAKIPSLFLYDYPRYIEITDPFDELADDLSDEVAEASPGLNLGQQKDIRSIITEMAKYNQDVAVLRAVATAFTTGETYPAYLDETKTLFENTTRYLTTMKNLIESFVQEYESVYLPSVASEEKKDIMRTVSKELRTALSWIGIISTYYSKFEDFAVQYKKADETVNELMDSLGEPGLGSTISAILDEAVEVRNRLIIDISAVATQYHKYYDDLNSYLLKYKVIDPSNISSMDLSLQTLFEKASQEDTGIQYNTETLSVPGVGGQAPSPSPVLTSSTGTGVQTLEIEEDIQNAVNPEDREIEREYISTDKNIFKTKYANRLFVVPRKRASVNKSDFYKANLSVCIKPCVKIAEVPFFEVSGVVIDDPPVFPNVDLIPYKGVKNKILINLNSSVGEYSMMPVTFNSREKQIVDKIRDTKGLESDEPIIFSTDDRAEAFEIYRMETPPEKIEDFSNNLRKYLLTDVNQETLQKASSASFVDDIEPNTEYYYTFRTVDNHGKISNPSPVYKLIMVENDGAVYPLMEVHQMKKIIPQKPTKTCKKLINIAPRYSQGLINLEKSNIGDGSGTKEVKNIVLGLENRPLFGRKFKVRLTSKKTGKKIDLNINFNVKLDKI